MNKNFLIRRWFTAFLALPLFFTIISILFWVIFGNHPVLILHLNIIFQLSLLISVFSILIILIIWRCNYCHKTFLFKVCAIFPVREICPNCQNFLQSKKRMDFLSVLILSFIIVFLVINSYYAYKPHVSYGFKIPLFYKIDDMHGDDSWDLKAVKYNKQITINMTEGMTLSSIIPEKIALNELNENPNFKKENIILDNGKKVLFYSNNDSGEIWIDKNDNEFSRLFTVEFLNSQENLDEIREIINTIEE